MEKAKPPKNTIKELCVEDKAKIGQLVQKIAIEKANRRKSEDQLSHESQSLDKILEELQKENQKLFRESSILQDSLNASFVQMESLQHTQIFHSSNPSSFSMSNNESILTPKPSTYIPSKEHSTSISIQMSCDKEIQSEIASETLTPVRKPMIKSDLNRVIEKARETSNRLEKLFSYPLIQNLQKAPLPEGKFNTPSSPTPLSFEKMPIKYENKARLEVSDVISSQKYNFTRVEPDHLVNSIAKEKTNKIDDEILVIEESFYDSHLLDVIDQMADFEEL